MANAYIQFVKKYYPRVKAKYPNMKPQDRMRLVAQVYRKKKASGQLGAGFFDAFSDALSSIPSALGQIPGAIKSGWENRNEVISRANQIKDWGEKALPLLGLGRRRRKRRC